VHGAVCLFGDSRAASRSLARSLTLKSLALRQRGKRVRTIHASAHDLYPRCLLIDMNILKNYQISDNYIFLRNILLLSFVFMYKLKMDRTDYNTQKYHVDVNKENNCHNIYSLNLNPWIAINYQVAYFALIISEVQLKKEECLSIT